MITLELVKEHLRVDFDDEDTLITAYMSAAHAHILDYCDVDDIGDISEEIANAAMLLLVGDLYVNREAQNDRKLFENETVNRLLSLQRKLSM